MKKILFVALALVIPLCCAYGKKGEPTRVRWCSFNLRVNSSADAQIGCAWETRRDRVCQWLKDSGIDIAGFQEVTSSMLPDLVERLPEYAHVEQGRRGLPERDEMTPVFYRKDKYEELAHGTFWLSETPDIVGSKGWDGAHPRIATWIRLRDKQTGQVFVAVSTHFDHKGQKARLESGKLLTSKIPQIAGKDPVMICGDFNMYDTSPGYAAIVGAEYVLRDAYFMSPHHTGVRYSFHSFSRIAPEKARRIDFIFLSRQIQVKQTHIEPNIADAPLSDHNPVWADLEF